MSTDYPFSHRPRAFTLIELLVVIAIIGLLAGMILPVGVHLKIRASTKHLQTQMEQISTMIESYKAKRSHYPADNPSDPTPEADPTIRPVSPLLYELTGAELQAGSYRTTRGAVFNSSQLNAAFGIKGIANSTVAGGNPDESPRKVNFAQGLDQNSVATISISGSSAFNVEVLASKLRGPMGTTNLWHYTVGRPNAHNPNSFDLWLDVTLGRHNLRICNWSSKPIKL
jgi:prepilin-type N-terminal cleavage/methylation domain-containing protein